MNSIQLSLYEIMTILGFLVVIGGAVNGIVFALLRSRFVPRSFLFCPTGAPIYRTVKDCKEMEEKMETERREKESRIEESIQAKIDNMEKTNKAFMETLAGMFQSQTKQIKKTVENVVS